jgi:hypothetical protein
MPKPLNKPQPTSSVAKLLEPGVAAAALAPVESTSNNTSTVTIAGLAQPIDRSEIMTARMPTGELANITRQFILTLTTDETLKRLVTLYSNASGSELTNSHVLRAILKGVAHAMPELEREASRLQRLKRPSNARGKEYLREEFERRIAAAFVAGMRAAALYGTNGESTT